MADIWLLDLATHKYRNLTNHPSNFRPSWSPDGKWIAFTSDRDTHPGRVSGAGGSTHGGFEFLQSTNLYVISADGGRLRQLTQTSGFAGSPKWSADGRRIVYYQSSSRIVGVEEKARSDRDFGVANHQRRRGKWGPEATHQWTWHEGVTTVAERGSCRVREETGQRSGP